MIAVETCEFSNGFDYGISLKFLFKPMKSNLPLYILTESKIIFDTVKASKKLKELHLMNDMSEIGRAYRNNEITNVAWIKISQNIAKNLTRLNGNQILPHAMRTGKLDFKIEKLKNGYLRNPD